MRNAQMMLTFIMTDYTRKIICFIPEQFIVKAHPALFEGEGRGGG